MPVEVTCSVCGKIHSITPNRVPGYKTCSKACQSTLTKSPPNTTCIVCDKRYHLKPYHQMKFKTSCCSRGCRDEYLKTAYLGKQNPNYRKVARDSDGYALDCIPEIGRVKLHHYAMWQVFGFSKVPKGYCVHHRDCDIDHNHPENLTLLTGSDHRWLHKQFGNATLWAYSSGKVELQTLLGWTNDQERARRLLPLNFLKQHQSGVFKSCELLGNPEVGNQQPSPSEMAGRFND